MDECEVCYAQVAHESYPGHIYWHQQQREIMELMTKTLEGSLSIVERMVRIR